MQLTTMKGDGSDTEYQSLTYTDGIYLQSITGDNLELVIQYLYHMDDPEKEFKLPEGFHQLIELFETADYLNMDSFKVPIVQKINKQEQFLKFTNVRRHCLDNI